MEHSPQPCSEELTRQCLVPPLAKRGIEAKKHLFLRIGDKKLELTRDRIQWNVSFFKTVELLLKNFDLSSYLNVQTES